MRRRMRREGFIFKNIIRNREKVLLKKKGKNEITNFSPGKYLSRQNEVRDESEEENSEMGPKFLKTEKVETAVESLMSCQNYPDYN